MTAITTPKPSFCSLDGATWDEMGHAISSLTLSPPRQIIYYLLPRLAGWFAGSTPLSSPDISHAALLSEDEKTKILTNFQSLVRASNIFRNVGLSTQLNHVFWHAGGRLSFTSPTVFVPFTHLLNSNQSYTPKSSWQYTPDQTNFLIARELAHIKDPFQYVRLILKIAFVASAIFVCATPTSLLFAGCLLTTILILHFASERIATTRADREGLKILRKVQGNTDEAKVAATLALEAQTRQNLQRRQISLLARLYISKSGNNFLDLSSPLLTTRIENLQKILA